MTPPRNPLPVVGAFRDNKDDKSGLYLDRRVARLDKGILNPQGSRCTAIAMESFILADDLSKQGN